MGDSPLAGELPSSNKVLVFWPFEDNSAAELVEHGSNSRGTEAVFEVVRIAEAALDLFSEANVALAIESVPEEDGGMAVAATHDGGISGG